MKEFDFYQIAGVIAPGMVVVACGMILFFPEQQQNLLSIASVSLGSFGLGLILAYVAGQLLQAVGNVIEKIWWWFWGGMPTDWIRTAKHELIARTQANQVQHHVRNMLNDQMLEIATMNKKQWYAITRQMYSVVQSANKTSRIDTFNGNYGLCRGIASAFLLLLIALMVSNITAWKTGLILVSLIILALLRMHRFGVHYGRELIIEYLNTCRK